LAARRHIILKERLTRSAEPSRAHGALITVAALIIALRALCIELDH
jgi:hypothetical protein